jgi:GNAT superfamily N-acetyltransferase
MLRHQSSKESGLNGDLPAGIRFEIKPNQRGVLAWLPGDQIVEVSESPWPTTNEVLVGELNWTETGMVSWIVVPYEELRRRGIADAMWNLAKTVRPDIHHGDERSESGDAWSQHASGLNGDLPLLTFSLESDGHLIALVDEKIVADIIWNSLSGEVKLITVRPDWRRKGIADALFAKALEINPNVHHSTEETDDGYAWAHRVADYQMYHQPPDPDPQDGTPSIDALGDALPDLYEHPEYYWPLSDSFAQESIRVVRAVKGNPNAQVTIYRALPPEYSQIDTGNWVAVSLSYARQHAMSEGWPVISAVVSARDVYFGGNDYIEYGYWGGTVNGSTV